MYVISVCVNLRSREKGENVAAIRIWTLIKRFSNLETTKIYARWSQEKVHEMIHYVFHLPQKLDDNYYLLIWCKKIIIPKCISQKYSKWLSILKSYP